MLTGRSRAHITDLDSPRCALHREVVAPFLRLHAAAAEAGIDLLPVSSYRDFERQRLIWNAKFRGERAVLDEQGNPLDALALNEPQRVAAILVWSALPGASRHHWGTEIDVVDANALAGAPVALLATEYAAGGRFAHLSDWLDKQAAQFGFHRPYTTDRGGVRPEPWHLSHVALAEQALAAFSVDMLQATLQQQPIEAAQTVQESLPEIWQRYVVNVDRPDAVSGAAS
jgi:LAS superfamily LD-carboxypeptidase LdcB